MKKLLVTISLLLCFIASSKAQFYQQYFDGADTNFNQQSWQQSIDVRIDTGVNNIWQIGRPRKAIFDSAATIPNVMVTDTVNFYPENNTSVFRFKIRPNVNWGILALRWKQKLDMDSSLDGGLIEYTIDKGNTWTSVFNNPYVYNFYGFLPHNKDTLANGDFAFSGTDSSWRDIWLCFSMSWLNQVQDTFEFRFTFKSDSIDNSKEGWMIDNLIASVTYIHIVKEVQSNKYLSVYPNPASTIVNVETEKLSDFHIIEKMELIDPLGKVVDCWENIPTKFWFTTEKYNKGLYFLKVRTNIKTETVPIVIEKN